VLTYFICCQIHPGAADDGTIFATIFQFAIGIQLETIRCFTGSQPIGHGGVWRQFGAGQGGREGGSASRSLDTSASALLAVPESTISQPRRQSR
jgi:hypothetical protein